MIRKNVLWLTLGMLGMMLGVAAFTAVHAAPAATMDAGIKWDADLLISGGSISAEGPSVDVSTDGQEIIVVYTRTITSSTDRDPYYAQSTNGGQTWPINLPIYTSNGVDSVGVSVTIDGSGRGHAAWVEGTSLVYLREEKWGSGTPTLLSTMPNADEALEHVIRATGNNVIDVVWSQRTLTNPNIWHTRSGDGGTSWSTPTLVADTGPSSFTPAMTTDSSGNIYVVWQERTLPTPVLNFAQRVNNTWSTPIEITTRVNIPANNGTYQPEIVRRNNQLIVFFTVRDEVNPALKANQSVYALQCGRSCSSLSNWYSVNNPVSGSFVEVSDQSPTDIISSAVNTGDCVINFFHGADINDPANNPNELIWNVNSCLGWGNPQRVTNFEASDRAFLPSAAANGNRRIFLTYQRDSATDSQVWLKVGVPIKFIHLPLIVK